MFSFDKSDVANLRVGGEGAFWVELGIGRAELLGARRRLRDDVQSFREDVQRWRVKCAEVVQEEVE